ncbi:MAG: hypothetical protein U0P30_12445 [Vicinamibacterales bacterium]
MQPFEAGGARPQRLLDVLERLLRRRRAVGLLLGRDAPRPELAELRLVLGA